MKRKILFLASLLVCFIFISPSFAADPPSTQTAGGLMEQGKQIDLNKNLKEKIETEKPKQEDMITSEMIPDDDGKKVLIKKIVVEGVTLISQEMIKKITDQFKGQELSLRKMQMVADLITDEYRKKGYVTSRAYLPPQTMKDSTLILRVIEGKMGSLEIRGNRYFRTSLIRKKIDLRSKGYFDFIELQKSLVLINEHPDRTAKAVLVPGVEPGTTDIVIDVKDRIPIHVGFNYDNYASRYLGRNRVTGYVEHNNLLGFDDKFYFKYTRTRDGSLRLSQGQYTFPVFPDLNLGVYGATSASRLGREFSIVDSRGKVFIAGIFANKTLYNTENFDLRWNTGLDYKDIKNNLLSIETSRDKVRVFKTGLDFDYSDAWGRNIFTTELDVGLPEFMDGMKAKDPHSSRGGVGSGGKFQKWVFNYFRLQPGPFSSEILWKNSAQVSNHNLIAGEQFQIGGPGSVRGYPIGEFAGDQGIYSSLEWSFPPYFISRNARIPFLKNRTWFESLRLVTFYDFGHTRTKTVLAGEKESRTLQAAGFGFRFNLGENFFARIEFGYPLSGPNPSDGQNMQKWFEITTKF